MTRRTFTTVLLGLGLGALAAACTGPPSSGPSAGSPRPDDGTRIDRIYRVQIGLFSDKEAANRAVGRAARWWETVPRDARPEPLRGVASLPVDVHWRAPYYRVRVGPFVARDRAEDVLQVMQDSFPDAFIAPERVRSSPDPSSSRDAF